MTISKMQLTVETCQWCRAPLQAYLLTSMQPNQPLSLPSVCLAHIWQAASLDCWPAVWIPNTPSGLLHVYTAGYGTYQLLGRLSTRLNPKVISWNYGLWLAQDTSLANRKSKNLLGMTPMTVLKICSESEATLGHLRTMKAFPEHIAQHKLKCLPQFSIYKAATEMWACSPLSNNFLAELTWTMPSESPCLKRCCIPFLSRRALISGSKAATRASSSKGYFSITGNGVCYRTWISFLSDKNVEACIATNGMAA